MFRQSYAIQSQLSFVVVPDFVTYADLWTAHCHVLRSVYICTEVPFNSKNR